MSDRSFLLELAAQSVNSSGNEIEMKVLYPLQRNLHGMSKFTYLHFQNYFLNILLTGMEK